MPPSSPQTLATESEQLVSAGWPRRYTVVVLFALATALCYIDRVNISIAIIPLAKDKGYDAATRGVVLSAFFWGYAWPQMIGGWIADRFGGKRVLAVGVALWSLATFLTPLAASVSFGMLFFMRAALGVGEALNFPAVHSLAARWTIASERARAISLHFSGTAFGTIIALLISPPIIIYLGWRAVFYISGATGIIWLLFWWRKAADSPEDCADLSPDELAVIKAGRPDMPLAESIPWRRIFTEKSVWAIVIAHLCNNFGFYILLLWLPSYLDHQFHVPMKQLGKLSVIPYVAAFTMQNFSGWFADRLHHRGMSLTTVRKMMQATSFALGGSALLLLPTIHSAGAAVALTTLSLAGTGIGAGGFIVNHIDIAPRYAGILMGLSNTFATLPGIIGVAATGFILEATGSFSAVFYLIAMVYAVGALAYVAMASGERQI
ncbi:MAG TPA: ACS family MFS transporter [Candidatus Binataceae bacterium]|nr:ACS family MFS transporter [Candidatus Binataceae bacterium]